MDISSDISSESTSYLIPRPWYKEEVGRRGGGGGVGKPSRFAFYCINTSGIPGELSLLNMISSHVTITCYFTRENIMLFSQVKRFPLLWLHNPLDLLLYALNIIGSSSESFGYL